MPLRDHFRPPLSDRRSWEGFQGGWPMMIVNALGPRLPARFIAEPQVHLGDSIKIDVASLADLDEYEVRVYDTSRGRRLVAAVEIVSPANKDRPEHRRAFVAKCAALLQSRVCVAIIDLVTTRSPNLHIELMDSIGPPATDVNDAAPSLYAVALRALNDGDVHRLETWAHPLAIGAPLPTLPLWVAPGLAVPLELELSYEETCRVLRIA